MISAGGRVGLGEQLFVMNALVTTLIGSPMIVLNDGALRRKSVDGPGDRSASSAISSKPFETTCAAFTKRSLAASLSTEQLLSRRIFAILPLGASIPRGTNFSSLLFELIFLTASVSLISASSSLDDSLEGALWRCLQFNKCIFSLFSNFYSPE